PALFLEKGPLALDDLVRERVSAHAEQFRARSIALTHAVAPARVVGDPERLGQAVDNLLSNALRYTDPGGRVTVTLDARGSEATVTVADTGVGIAPEYLGRVFDRFWRAPGARARAAEGSGVGLALVSELVRAHGGTVEVSSPPGDGTSFQVRLPLAGEPANVAPAKPRGILVDAISRGRDAVADVPGVPRGDVNTAAGAAGR